MKSFLLVSSILILLTPAKGFAQTDTTEAARLQNLIKQLELQNKIIELQSAQSKLLSQSNTSDGSGIKFKNGNTYKEFNATVLTSSFNVPVVRFNFLDQNQANERREGNVALFNSIGAGINLNFGKLQEVSDIAQEEIRNEFTNIIGFQAGILYSTSTSETNSNNNVFAITGSVTVLNFQIGYGHELGVRAQNERKGFITVAYGIPLTSIVKGGFHVLKSKLSPSKDQNNNTKDKRQKGDDDEGIKAKAFPKNLTF